MNSDPIADPPGREIGDHAKYASRVAAQLEQYESVTEVHDLPAIYHYWSDRCVRPKLDEVGLRSINGMYTDSIIASCRRRPNDTITAISLGSGNGDTEISVAEEVLRNGVSNFAITCAELSPTMQARARECAESVGTLDYMHFEQVDLNAWTPSSTYDVIIASHSLHHVVELEQLLSNVRTALSPDGVFAVNDMIGRNGHMRWPEALVVVEGIWNSMPARYKYNHQLKTLDTEFVNRDYSLEGFEGIRAQDILPLLLEYLHPERFVAFGNVVDVFVDRGYGPNFSVDSVADCSFIDSVALLDELLLDLGVVKPTHVIGTFRTRPVQQHVSGCRAPEFCVRPALPAEPSSSDRGIEADLAAALDQLQRLSSSRSWRFTEPARIASRKLSPVKRHLGEGHLARLPWRRRRS